jgi:hypothetical protein
VRDARSCSGSGSDVRSEARRSRVTSGCGIALAVAAATVVDAIVAVDGVDGINGVLCAPWKECWK